MQKRSFVVYTSLVLALLLSVAFSAAASEIVGESELGLTKDDEFAISFTTDGPAQSQVAYGTDGQYQYETGLHVSLDSFHRHVLKEAVASTTYEYRITVMDWGGGQYIETGSFTTPSAISPAELHLETDENQVRIAWSPTFGAEQYRVERSGPNDEVYVPIAVVTHTAFVDVGVETGETYAYRVTAIDAQGKAGEPSASFGVSVKPQPTPGDWRPTVVAPYLLGDGPTLDGDLDEAFWVQAALADAKITVDLLYSNDSITRETSTVYLAYDDVNLYVGAINYDATHDLEDVAGGSWAAVPGMEVNIRVNDAALLHVLHIFVDGTVNFDQGGDSVDTIEIATDVFALGWTFELVIPFEALGEEPPVEGDSWMFQVGGLSDQWKAWRSTGSSNFLVENAGTLVFGRAFN